MAASITGPMIVGRRFTRSLPVETRGIEQVFDEFRLGAGVAVDDFQAVGNFSVELFLQEKLGPAEDGVKRGAKFVREGGEEFILDAIGFATRRRRWCFRRQRRPSGPTVRGRIRRRW